MIGASAKLIGDTLSANEAIASNPKQNSQQNTKAMAYLNAIAFG